MTIQQAGGNDPDDGRRLAAALGLQPLQDEGGLFRQTVSTAGMTAILYLLMGDDCSAMHRLDADEVYFHHAGAPLRMLLLPPDGASTEITCGADVLAGQAPQVVVPAGTWQGSSSAGAWTLVSTVVTPPFAWERFRLGTAADLTARYPAAARRIGELTRS